MEVGLAHALKEIEDPEDKIPLSLVIIIGDAPPNKDVGFIDLKKRYETGKKPIADTEDVSAINLSELKPHYNWSEEAEERFGPSKSWY
jgi:hypothetical protein